MRDPAHTDFGIRYVPWVSMFRGRVPFALHAALELITAVALPSILADLVDADGTSAWIELRKASWIINGYLLVYILAMPLAGRIADLWGTRRPFLAAL